MEQLGNTITVLDVASNLGLSLMGTVVCRDVALEHGRRYFSRVRVTNNASLTREVRAAGFLVDGSADRRIGQDPAASPSGL